MKLGFSYVRETLVGIPLVGILVLLIRDMIDKNKNERNR